MTFDVGMSNCCYIKSKNTALDTPEHVDSETFYFIKCGYNSQKLTKNGIFRFFLQNLIIFWPILATFYEFKSRFEKSNLFSISTNSGLSKISNLFLRALLGQQVPQHDVILVCIKYS
jgi:hypothetical protein